MQLVILHYHLNRGGVTSVIENHLRALASLEKAKRPTGVTVVYGGRDAAWNADLADELPFDCSLVALPALEYDNFATNVESLQDALQSLLNRFDRDSTILHIHNHSLGKNAQMAPVACQLAEQGWRLLLQIHDFAEDLRPANYRHLVSHAVSRDGVQEQLYPQAKQIHYVVLNNRDRQILEAAGVASDRMHLLPNPVRRSQDSLDEAQAVANNKEILQAIGRPADNHLVLYPVRPIRRKNLGEFLLWSLLAENVTLAITLAPLNPLEQASYQRWVECAAELELPVCFELAGKTRLAFEEVYAASDAIITTSVAEGFGMVYLEASLARRPLVGRSLPGVCDDFVAAGMQFPGLSETLALPAEELDVAALQQSHLRISHELRAAYGLPSSKSTLSADHSYFSGDTVDFGRLESNEQRSFLRRVKNEATLRETLRTLNPIVNTIRASSGEPLQQTFQHNNRVIAESYSPEVIGGKLNQVYQTLIASQPEPVRHEPAIAQAVLDRFVHPSQLFPIRLES